MKIAPYGTWSSPISSDVVFALHNEILEPPKVDKVTGNVFWVEQLSTESGHGVVFQYNIQTEQVERWTGPNVDVRNRVHEYGGGSLIVHNHTIFYTDASDGHVYKQVGRDGEAQKLTSGADVRYADGDFCPVTNKLFYVKEDHSAVKAGTAEYPKNTVVVVDLSNNLEETQILQHADFFASPRISRDGKRLVWVQWNLPYMPWGKTELYVGTIDQNNKMAYEKYLQNHSMMTPNWNQHNELLYIHEMTSWWNLYIINRRGSEVNLSPVNVEVGWPTWTLGTQAFDTSDAIGAHEAVVIVGNKLKVVNSQTAESRTVDTEFDSFSKGIVLSKDGKKAYTIAASKTKLPSVVQIDLQSGTSRQISASSPPPISEDYFSVSEQIQFPTTEEMFAYGHFYPPKNPDYSAPEGTKPPLIVRTHQGPTMGSSTALNMAYQFFTSRGFAILDVDHRGSSGYGRFYRNLLHKKWGIYDRADLLAGAEQLVRDGLVDGNSLFASGESAGGFSSLAVATFTDKFAGAASHFGISNLTRLTEDTHKFESEYMTTLVGNVQSQTELYEQRSPLSNKHNVTTPILFLHGTLDEVVPINQAESFFEALKDKGIPTAMVTFQGEHHGFTKLEHQKKALESEIYFYSRIGNFSLADVTSDVVIHNFPQ